MSKNIEQIHEFQFNQRLNILKGFKEVSGTAPLPIEDLRKSLGDEPLYTVENLEKYTKDVLTKGNENDIQKAKEVLNSLSCREVIDENGYVQNMYFYVEKGHMDFAGPSGGGGRQGLVKKQITDKTGRNTTKWVRANKDDEKQDKNPKAEEGSEDKSTESSSNNTKVQEHAKNTSTEDLKAYLQNNPDGEHAEHAKAELAARGVEGSEGDQEIDYNDSEAVKNALAAHPDREAIIDSAIENGITPAQALKMHESNKTDHSETHAAIDGAQAALDALKEKTRHPEMQNRSYEDDIEDWDEESVRATFDSIDDEDGELDNETLKEKFYQYIDVEPGEYPNVDEALDKVISDRNLNTSNHEDRETEESSNSVSQELHDQLYQMIGDISVNNTKNNRLNQDVIDSVYDSMDSGNVDYDKVISILGDYAANDKGATIKEQAIYDLIDKYDDEVDSASEGDQSNEEPGKDENDADSDDNEVDEDAERRAEQYDKDDYPEDDEVTEDDEEEAKKEIIESDLKHSFNKLDELVGDENFNIMDSQNPDSDYSKVLNYIADMVEEYEIDESTFSKIAKNFKGLDLVYSDFVRD